MSFDYGAPAELFLSKRFGNKREKYRRFATAAEAIRYAVEGLRTPKAFGAWLEVGMHASTAAKSRVCMKPLTIRCGSLNERAPRASWRRDQWGPLAAANLRKKTPIPDFKEQPERATAPYNLGARCGDRR